MPPEGVGPLREGITQRPILQHKRNSVGILPHMKTANIHNLTLVRSALEELTGRAGGLPSLGVLYGPAGYGKSTALLAVANATRAYYIQMRSVWNAKALMQKILIEMGLPTKVVRTRKSKTGEGETAFGRDLTVAEMLDQVGTQLAASRRPLIIDEFDYCVGGAGMVELVRDIHEISQAPIILSGEEHLPLKLQRWERFHGRVLSWIAAAPVSLADARELAPIYCNVACADDFLELLVDKSGGSVRRVCVNLSAAEQVAADSGWRKIDAKAWGDRPIYSGKPAARNEREQAIVDGTKKS